MGHRATPTCGKYEVEWQTCGTGGEMKVYVVCVLVVFAAASALAYGGLGVTSNMPVVAIQIAQHTNESATLLGAGTLLLGLAGAVKRFTV